MPNRTDPDPARVGVGRSDYHDRREARADRLEDRAARHEASANAAHNRARTMGEVMNGTPILVGHHSEGRHRRDLDRMDRTVRRAISDAKEAERLRGRAASARRNAAISSDDPDAIARLDAKVAELEAERDRLKGLAKAARAGDRSAQAEIAEACKHWPGGCDPAKGWPRGYLTNTSAAIRAARKRADGLRAQAERVARETTIGNFEIAENPEVHRTQIRTVDGSKPSAEQRRALKSSGFRWSPSETAWQRQISETAWRLAVDFAETAGAQ